jgi:hypothetical protein
MITYLLPISAMISLPLVHSLDELIIDYDVVDRCYTYTLCYGEIDHLAIIAIITIDYNYMTHSG